MTRADRERAAAHQAGVRVFRARRSTPAPPARGRRRRASDPDHEADAGRGQQREPDEPDAEQHRPPTATSRARAAASGRTRQRGHRQRAHDPRRRRSASSPQPAITSSTARRAPERRSERAEACVARSFLSGEPARLRRGPTAARARSRFPARPPRRAPAPTKIARQSNASGQHAAERRAEGGPRTCRPRVGAGPEHRQRGERSAAPTPCTDQAPIRKASLAAAAQRESRRRGRTGSAPPRATSACRPGARRGRARAPSPRPPGCRPSRPATPSSDVWKYVSLGSTRTTIDESANDRDGRGDGDLAARSRLQVLAHEAVDHAVDPLAVPVVRLSAYAFRTKPARSACRCARSLNPWVRAGGGSLPRSKIRWRWKLHASLVEQQRPRKIEMHRERAEVRDPAARVGDLEAPISPAGSPSTSITKRPSPWAQPRALDLLERPLGRAADDRRESVDVLVVIAASRSRRRAARRAAQHAHSEGAADRLAPREAHHADPEHDAAEISAMPALLPRQRLSQQQHAVAARSSAAGA